MRGFGCGLLLLACTALPTFGQEPGARPWPSLDEARNASGCDSTQWAKVISDIKATDPVRDADGQTAEGNFSLRSARSHSPVSSMLFVPRKSPSDVASSSHSDKAKVGVGFKLEEQPIDVHCHLDARPKEAFPIGLLEEATTDAATRWCGRAAMVLARDYASAFNRRVVVHPAYPHKDVCTLAPAGGRGGVGKISDPPAADLLPVHVPDAATAARFGLANRVSKFISEGADLGHRDEFNLDALTWAVVRGYRSIFDLLLASSGKFDFCAALEAAVTHQRIEPLTLLAQRCALHEPRLRLMPSAVREGNAQVVKVLVDAEPALALTEVKEVAQALQIAAATGRADLVRLLLDRALLPQNPSDWWDKLLRDLLGAALAGHKLGVAELLLERGVSPGPHALHRAVEGRAREVARVLVRHGADLNGARALGPRAQVVAPASVAVDPLGRQQLPSRGDEASMRKADPPIFLALDPLQDFEMIDLLLDLGADPNVRDSSGRTPLMVAIARSQIYGKKGGVRWIERHVPQRLIEGQEDWEHRGVQPVRALLAKGADVAASDRDGLTALHYAARSDYSVEIAQILLERGADVRARDTAGRTPPDHARELKLTRMPRVLAAASARNGSQ